MTQGEDNEEILEGEMGAPICEDLRNKLSNLSEKVNRITPHYKKLGRQLATQRKLRRALNKNRQKWICIYKTCEKLMTRKYQTEKRLEKFRMKFVSRRYRASYIGRYLEGARLERKLLRKKMKKEMKETEATMRKMRAVTHGDPKDE